MKTEKKTTSLSPEGTDEETRYRIFCGDSRTKQLSNAVASSENGYVAKYGQGYNWFSNEGLTELKKLLRMHPQADVVLNFGVNDLYNISQIHPAVPAADDDLSAGTFLYHVCQSGGR